MTKRSRKILCATCRESIDADAGPCPLCGKEARLAGRYQLLAPLGRGASGITWRARRIEDRRLVAIKERRLVDARSFRELDRLRREAEFLERLDHPNIPRLVEHFVLEEGPRSGFYLVTQLVRGRTLAEEMAATSVDVGKVLEDLASLLDVLAYLHTRSPAVVHGDVKPENVVRRESDGALFLVDFHAARTFPSLAEVGMTTAIGTPGFMAPEQLLGHAEPATDVHAAACVAIAMLSRRPLYTLVDDDFRLKWKQAVAVPAPVRHLFERMLEPSLSRRAKNAGALAAEARRLARGRPSRAGRLGALSIVASAAVLAGAISLKAVSAGRTAFAAARSDGSSLVGEVLPNVGSFVWRTKCEEHGTCSRVNQGAIADSVRTACASMKKAKSSVWAFPIELHSTEGHCIAHRERDTFAGESCVASCEFGSYASTLDRAQLDLLRLKNAISDLYGKPTSTTNEAHLDGTTKPRWHWRDDASAHARGVWSMSAAVLTGASADDPAAHLELVVREPC